MTPQHNHSRSNDHLAPGNTPWRWEYGVVALLLTLVLVLVLAYAPGAAPRAEQPVGAPSQLFLPLVNQNVAIALPTLVVATTLESAVVGAPPVNVQPTPSAAPLAEPAITHVYLALAANERPPAAEAATPPALHYDLSACTVYANIRVTWYELGSCCNKAPGHPQYGITRSGLPVEWGMAAVQARRPLLPMGTRFILADIGPMYEFMVTDTGSETAFGSNWIDVYAPSIEIGLWVERQIGSDGRSDVLVCP